MEGIKLGNILTLSDGNDYVISGITDYNDKRYLYLVNMDETKTIKFVLLNNMKVTELNPDKDYDLIMELLPRFLKSIIE